MITLSPPPDGLLSLISVMIWQPITGYVIFMNENEAGWLSKVFGEGEQTSCLFVLFIQIQGIVPTFYGVWCAAVTTMSTQPSMKECSLVCEV